MKVWWTKEVEDLMVAEGWITRRRHPEFPLYILNYTPKTVYKRLWNELTLRCRGLIVDEDRNIVAWPLHKFFNLEELKEVPRGNFEVYDKLDGSLGITYHYDGKTYISTRGSFGSDQAVRGTELLRSQFCCTPLDPAYTYLFEIICEQSRYVVDYKSFEGLVLLAVIDKETGEELDISQFTDWVRAERYPLSTFGEVIDFVDNRVNAEGVVLKFEDGTRVKVKSAEYLRKFAIINGLTPRWVWEQISRGIDLVHLVDDATLPEESRAWLRGECERLFEEFEGRWSQCLLDFSNAPKDTRKEFAVYATKREYPHVLFALLENKYKKAEAILWETLKP